MQKELPIGWVETKLGIVAEWGSGGTPNRSEPNYYNGTIPWVKTGDLNDSIILEASEYISELGLKKSSAKLFPKGSIIVAMYGATIGKTAKLGIDATTNQACAVAQASKIVIPEFLHYFLKSEKQEFIEKGKGGAQPNISQTVIKEHPFPLPPFPEQQRIVAKLDTLFGHLDALKTRLDRIPQLLKDFRQKVLTQAVTGKLTEEWREGKGIVDRWETIVLDSICEKPRGISYGVIKLGEPIDNGIPCLRTSDVKPLYIDTNLVKKISRSISDNYKRTLLKGNEVLVNIRGTLGGIAAVPNDLIGWNVSREIATVPLLNSVNKKYIAVFIASTESQDWLNEVAKGIAYTGINLADLRNLPVGLPKREEQDEIVRRVESLFAKADQIEASYQKLKAKIAQLPQALLAKAFRGELVAQLPTDGNARDLLEQIKQAKAGLEKGGKGRKMKVEDEVRMVAEEGARYGKR